MSFVRHDGIPAIQYCKYTWNTYGYQLEMMGLTVPRTELQNIVGDEDISRRGGGFF